MNKTENKDSKTSAAFILSLVLSAAAPFAMVPGMYEYVKIPQSALIQCTTLLILLVHLLCKLLGEREISLSLNLPGLFFTAFMTWSLICVFIGINHYEGLIRWGHWAACGIIFMVLCSMGINENQGRHFFWGLSLSGILISILGICQHIFSIDLIPQSAGPAATFANKNMAAQYIVQTLPLALTLFIISRSATQSLLWALGSALMTAYLIYTGTRAAWVAAAVELAAMALVLILVWRNRSQLKSVARHKVISSTAGTVLFLILIHSGPGGMGFYLQDILHRAASIFPAPVTTNSEHSQISRPATESKNHRIAIWTNTIEMIKANPIAGVGLGNHKILYPLFQEAKIKDLAFSEGSQLENVHNDLLQVLCETGMIGLFLILASILGLVYCFIRKARLLSHSFSAQMILWGSGLSLLGIFINAQFSFPFQMPIPPLVTAVLCAVIAGRDCVLRPYYCRIPRHVAVSLIPIIMLLLGGMTLIHARLIKSDFWLWEAKVCETQNNWPCVITASQEAYKTAPFRVKPLTLAARAQIESGKFQNGAKNLELFLSQYPYQMNALMNMGVAYIGLNQHRLASRYLTQALEIKPDWAKAHQNLAAVRMAENDYQGAIVHFKAALKQVPDNPVLLYNLGLCHFHLKDYSKAATAMARSAILQPDLPNVQLNLAILYYEHLDRKDQSIEYFKAALKQTPNLPNAGHIRAILEQYHSMNRKNQ